MAADTLIPVVQYLHRITAPTKPAGLTDGELLERFAGRRDQAAFAALVQRHGAMVMGVCRRLLRDRHEAEDAWQATFLILVRKAGAIARRELLAGWLYGVAYRTARRARRVAARRQARERPAGDAVVPASVPAEAWPDLRPILDEEIQRLPEKYRLPVILCYFENKTNSEAALLLNCPRGTIATRLARARERLRVRLTRRGVTLSAGGVALALAQDAMPATLPGMLAEATARAGWLLAAEAPAVGGITVQAAGLAQGVMRMMVVTKLKAVLALVLAVGAVGAVGSGSGLVGLRMRASENAAEQPARTVEGKAPLPAAPAAKPEQANLEDRIYAALRKDRYWKSTDLRCAVWVREVKERILHEVLFKQYDSDGVAEVVARARESEIHVDLLQQRILIHAQHVSVHSPMKIGWAYFADRLFIIPLSPPAPKVQTDKQVEKPREDASITLLGFPVSLSLMGERLDPRRKMSLSCDNFVINGQSVAIRGGVRAIQGTTRLRCDEFQVTLDQPITSITQLGQRGWKECRCNKNACLEDRVREGGRLIHYTRLVAPAMTIGGAGEARDVNVEHRNGLTFTTTIGGEEGGVRAAGPGTFHDLHQGPTGGPGAEQVLTLWRISYKGRVNISPKERHVHFEDQVEVACAPSDEPDPVIDFERLPEGGMVFRGGDVTFLGQKSAKRQAGRQLVIRDQAVFQNGELWGEADNIIYDEDTGRLTLRADGSTPAFLIRAKKDGFAPERMTGQKIIYSLKTHEFDILKNNGASTSP